MTLPSNSSNPLSPFLNTASADMDVNSLMNNREFQELLQEYFQNSTMTLDEFLENLPRFMMENYGTGRMDEIYDDEEQEDEEIYSEDEDLDPNDEDPFMAYLRQNQSGTRQTPLDTSEVLFRSLLAGRRASREIPLRNILPQSPPPSPVPNIVNTAPFFQRNRMAPQVPSRPEQLRRVPSQLRRSTTSTVFDPNAPEDCKSPTNYLSSPIPTDRNNGDFPITNSYMNRYGHSAVTSIHNNLTALILEEAPER